MNDFYNYKTQSGLAGYSPKYNYGEGTSGTDMKGFTGYKSSLDSSYNSNIPEIPASNVPNTQGGGLLDWGKNNLQGIGSTLQGVGGLANAYLGYKQYGLAKDAFDFQKKAFNRNIENQGKTLNNEIASRARVGLAMTDMSPEEKEARLDSIIEKRSVNTDPIK